MKMVSVWNRLLKMCPAGLKNPNSSPEYQKKLELAVEQLYASLGLKSYDCTQPSAYYLVDSHNVVLAGLWRWQLAEQHTTRSSTA